MHPLLRKYAKGGPVLGPDEESYEDQAGGDHLESIASECIDAIHSNDPARLVECLRAMFHNLDMEPHAEGPHEEE